MEVPDERLLVLVWDVLSNLERHDIVSARNRLNLSEIRVVDEPMGKFFHVTSAIKATVLEREQGMPILADTCSQVI